MSDKITITIDGIGGDVSVGSFTSILRETIEALDVFDIAHRGSERDAAEWRIVELSKKNPARITIESRCALAVGSFITILNKLEQGKVEAHDAPFQAIAKIKKITSHIGKDANMLLFDVPEHAQIAPTREAYANAAVLVGGRFYRSEGTIDGRLELVNVHKRYAFNIYDDLDEHPIRCTFPEDVLSVVQGNLGKRVSVSGEVKYRVDDDQPISIKATEIEPLENGQEPRLFSDMPAIDITGGEPSQEYIRRMRDGE